MQHAGAIKATGIDEIVSVAVNDAMVMAAWGCEDGATGKISMLSDGLGEFTRAVGLEKDLSDRGLGLRSKRYARLIEGGKVAEIHVKPPGAGESVLAMPSHLERVGCCDTALVSHVENTNSSRRATSSGATACPAHVLCPPRLLVASRGRSDGTSVARLLSKVFFQG